ncbi:MAG TPA: GNAT family N-acetyltransferase [Pyrinomonadaceae bacterium]|nr:GNAT family N-acetyltransferase [Pyrinomonadaceae bacterium]
MMNIRRYTSGDLESVVAIFRSNIPKYFGPGEESGLRDFLEKFSDDYYVCEIDGDIVGAGGIAVNADQTVSLCWGMIREDHLGTGRGRALTEFRINKAREKFGGLPLVISTSQHTQGFYERFGFRLTEHTPNGFGPGIDICKMRLDW